jgi:toxin-antitoxin system PIN domain toxin
MCDANVWPALALFRHVHHRTALRRFETIAQPGDVLFCRATQHTLLRQLTNSAVLAPYGNPPLTNAQAWKAYEAFAADDRIALRVDEPTHIESRWKQLAARDTASPKLWMYAYLAAFAITAGLRLVTTDIAFRQFAGLDHLILA